MKFLLILLFLVQETETETEEVKEFYGTKAANKNDTISPNTKSATGIRVVTSPHLKQFHKKQAAGEKSRGDNNNNNTDASEQIGFEADDQGWLPKRSKSNLSDMKM